MKKSVALLLIVAAVAISYAPAVQDGFVWDDTALVLRDPLIRSWRLIPEGFNHFLFVDATASDFYRPMQRLVYTLEYCVFGFTPAAFHALNILLHASAAAVLFLFAQEFLLAFRVEERRRNWIALGAAVLWAVHPVHSAAVIYVSGLADPLAAVFGLLGCYFCLRAARGRAGATIGWIAAAGLSFVGSVLSKENGFVFIAVALTLLALLRSWPTVWKVAVAAVFVGTIYFLLRLPAEHHPTPVARDAPPWSERPITMARALAEYSGLVALPLNLHMDRQLNATPRGVGEQRLNSGAWRELQTLLGVALATAFFYVAIRARKKHPVVFALLVLAAVSYLPVSGVWLLNAAVAEHWLYLPSIFLLLALAVAVVDLAFDRAWPRAMRLAVAVLIFGWTVFLGSRTFVRTFDWKDQRTFLERTIASGGDSARMLINLGGLELSEGRLDLAKKYLRVALQKEPNQPLAIINLAAVALRQNDFSTARNLLNRATQMPVVDARANELLAILDSKEHGTADLLRMRLASRTGPSDWSIERRYIRLLDEAGSTAGAIRELEHCLATEWYRAESWQLLADLQKKAGQPGKAAEALAFARKYDVHLDVGTKPL